jgi:hypothetical protein
MDALYDRTGSAVAFLDGTRIMSLQGASLAWVDGSGNVYDYGGQHLGWWRQGHMRGHDGGVVAWMRGATGVGVPLPNAKRAPPSPRRSAEPHRQTPALPPPQPGGKLAWSSQSFGADAG